GSTGWSAGKNDRGDDRTYNSTDYRSPGARASEAQAEPADDGGRYCDRAARAHAAQGAIAAGRLIYDVARRLLRATIFPSRALGCGAIISPSKSPLTGRAPVRC